MRFLRWVRKLANTRWDLNPFQIAFLFLIGGVLACVVISFFDEVGFLWWALPGMMALLSFSGLPEARGKNLKWAKDPRFVRQSRWVLLTSLVLSGLLSVEFFTLGPITLGRLKFSLAVFVISFGLFHFVLSIFWGLGMALSSLFKPKPVLTDFDAIDHSRFD